MTTPPLFSCPGRQAKPYLHHRSCLSIRPPGGLGEVHSHPASSGREHNKRSQARYRAEFRVRHLTATAVSRRVQPTRGLNLGSAAVLLQLHVATRATPTGCRALAELQVLKPSQVHLQQSQGQAPRLTATLSDQISNLQVETKGLANHERRLVSNLAVQERHMGTL